MKFRKALSELSSVPNQLSVLRLVLIPIFILAFFSHIDYSGPIAACILILSGATDFLDGIIARRFNMTTYLGKILDPLADKLTQAAVCICLVIAKVAPWWLLLIFVVKEFLMIIGGASIMKKGIKLYSSKWYGKLATFVFYLIMIIIIMMGLHRGAAVYALICTALGFMVFSFIMYLRIFLGLMAQTKAKKQPSERR